MLTRFLTEMFDVLLISLTVCVSDTPYIPVSILKSPNKEKKAVYWIEVGFCHTVKFDPFKKV